nr:MAG TPA: hypothetical protein [Caudoviricetes sp.]
MFASLNLVYVYASSLERKFILSITTLVAFFTFLFV